MRSRKKIENLTSHWTDGQQIDLEVLLDIRDLLDQLVTKLVERGEGPA